VKRVYIAGPMTGYPNHNVAAFDAAKDQLATEGVVVVSPPDITRANPQPGIHSDGSIDPAAYKALVKLDLVMMLECDEVVVLSGWERSKGARLEIAVAQACGIPVLWFETRRPIQVKVEI